MIALLDVAQEQPSSSSSLSSSANNIEDGRSSPFSKLLQGIKTPQDEKGLVQEKSTKDGSSKQQIKLPKNMQELLAVVGDESEEDVTKLLKSSQLSDSSQGKKTTTKTPTTLEDLMGLKTSQKNEKKVVGEKSLNASEKKVKTAEQVISKEKSAKTLEDLVDLKTETKTQKSELPEQKVKTTKQVLPQEKSVKTLEDLVGLKTEKEIPQEERLTSKTKPQDSLQQKAKTAEQAQVKEKSAKTLEDLVGLKTEKKTSKEESLTPKTKPQESSQPKVKTVEQVIPEEKSVKTLEDLVGLKTEKKTSKEESLTPKTKSQESSQPKVKTAEQVIPEEKSVKTLEDLVDLKTEKQTSKEKSLTPKTKPQELSQQTTKMAEQVIPEEKSVKTLEDLVGLKTEKKVFKQENGNSEVKQEESSEHTSLKTGKAPQNNSKKSLHVSNDDTEIKGQFQETQKGANLSQTTLSFSQGQQQTSIEEKKYVTSLVADAKSYVTQQINTVLATMPEIKQPQKMPQTLQGLVNYAKELKIDVSKVSVDEFAQKGTKAIAEGLQPKEMPKSSKLPASFQAQISTQEIVHTKQVQVPQQNIAKGSVLTADFSVQTARVIAPKETLIQESALEKEFTTESIKTQTQQPLKTDSLEVKMQEAKQMVKYLSQDVKTAIDNYKSPFTRVKVQLNPQNLGEMELTVVQRGKNLHINLSSNNTALNTLAMNVSDLKIQLQHNGIQNASVNFNSNSQQGFDTSGGNNSNAQQQQSRQQAQREYNYFDINDEHDEILDSIEIVVPSYA